MKKTLIVVDVQHDFYHPLGSLYVRGGENILSKIRNIISQFDHIIFTLDWHPSDHCSFKDNNGQWPVHCVKYTYGASLPFELLCETKGNVSFYHKGMSSSIEEYGAFGELAIGNEFLIKERIQASNSTFTVCGIAGDYCVLETIKNLLKLVPKEQVSVFLDGIVSIDGGEKLNNFIQENNLKIYQNDNQ